jgi:hypothetical protein
MNTGSDTCDEISAEHEISGNSDGEVELVRCTRDPGHEGLHVGVLAATREQVQFRLTVAQEVFEPRQHYVHQTIVPAYVWGDEAQRQALVTKTAQALLAQAESQQLDIVGDIGDAEIHLTFLQAQVGEVSGTKFVAYEPCEPGMADLVHVSLSQEVAPR